MEKKAIRVAYGEAIVKLGAENDKVVVLDADLAAATMTNGFKRRILTASSTAALPRRTWWIWRRVCPRWG